MFQLNTKEKSGIQNSSEELQNAFQEKHQKKKQWEKLKYITIF